MLTLLRLFKTLLRGVRLPRLQPHDDCVTHWRVLPGDIDLFGHMNNARYQTLMDLGRIDFLLRCGLFAGVLRERWIAPVGLASLSYRKPLKPFERFELHTCLVHWDERWFYFRQDFVRAGDASRPVASGFVKTLFVGRGGAVGTPEVIRATSGRELVAPPLEESLRAAFQLPPRPGA